MWHFSIGYIPIVHSSSITVLLAGFLLSSHIKHYSPLSTNDWLYVPIKKNNHRGHHLFLLVVSAPLKNMKINWDDDIPN